MHPAQEQDQDRYRALIAERWGAPVFAGGSPEADEEQAGDDQTTAPEAPEADAEDTSGAGAESFPDFDLSEVPEELRTVAEKYAQDVKKHFQGDYTRKTQGLAEERQETEEARRIVAALEDEKTAPAMLAALGYEFEEEAGPEIAPELVDPEERIEQLREQAEAQAQREAEADDQIAGELEALEGKENRKFDPEEVELLSVQALATGQSVEAVYGRYKALIDKRQAEWKEARKAPRRVSPGSPGSKAVDLTDPKQRRAAMIEAAEAAAAGASSD